MLFTSMEFLFLFLPATIAAYFFLPTKFRNYWLLVVSLFFYAWGEPIFVLVMMFSIICNYLAALRIEELEVGSFARKAILAISVMINLGLLFVFKYMNFVTRNLHLAFPTTKEMFAETSFVLPIGISFFTFQALSYVIDVYRGIPAQKNLCYVAMYISFFPQLIAGPIVRYTTIMDQIEHRTITASSFSNGVLRFIYGFNKKMLLANLLAEVADKAFASAQLSVAMAWLGAVCYTLQIFFDFSGYSEMAIGLGQMFGFNFLENFDYPYISKTITEFWRRWHISLGTWFRDYVYFPMSGSRVDSKFRLIFNLAVVWFATGVWHGASWNFIFWGALHGSIVIMEKILSLPKKLPKYKFVSVIYQTFTMFIVIIGWVLFRADGFLNGVKYIKSMFGVNSIAIIDTAFRFNLREYAVIIAAAIICSVPIIRTLKNKISGKGEYMKAACDIVDYIIQFILFMVGVSLLVMKAHNPFIYFNF